MIVYSWGLFGLTHVFGWKGSILPSAVCFALPNAVLAVLLHIYLGPDSNDHSGFGELGIGGLDKLWTGYTFVLGFLIVFRNNQAYSRFWDGANDLAELRGTWFNAVSNLVSFCSPHVEKQEEVSRFQNLLVRLASMLYCAALQEISDLDDASLSVLSFDGIDRESLQYLGKSSHKCEVLMQWIQQLIVDCNRNQIIDIPPPILSRVFQELSNGIVLTDKMRNIRAIPFPFPYVQMITVMLLLHWIVTPLVAAQCIQSVWGAGACCFFVTAAFWSPIFIARELDMPFGTDDNDLPVVEEMDTFNEKLLVLLHPSTQSRPKYTHKMCLSQNSKRSSGMVHTLQQQGAASSPDPSDASPASSNQDFEASASSAGRKKLHRPRARRKKRSSEMSDGSDKSDASQRSSFADLLPVAVHVGITDRVNIEDDVTSDPSISSGSHPPGDEDLCSHFPTRKNIDATLCSDGTAQSYYVAQTESIDHSASVTSQAGPYSNVPSSSDISVRC
eukprot:TRINITY_DN26103_c0_g1_i4.p1 TRINITY_DN26103_c0_g1~~TRINITY_DN26103_c0_g1_i4.p1  ORF type:complete len:501 (-),score=64.30 TRINITY_DN26103_c0_g1_i4:474-1976(-)